MFRSMSTRRGYEKLGKETDATGLLNEVELKRSTSVPSSGSNLSRKMVLQGSTSVSGNINLHRNPTKKGNNNKKKSHPLLSFLDRKKKLATARPDMVRYLEYVKEGGMWDLASNRPVLYYK